VRTALQADVTVLLMPSEERALALDKAYRLLVREQSFRDGRELVVNGAREVHQSVTADEKTGITEQVEPPWSSSRLAAAAIE
jgi:hypothetical protein